MAARFMRRRGAAEPRSPDSQWFWDHYEWAPAQLLHFCGEAGLTLSGLEMADVGCGDGILTLGVHRSAHPRRLVGFDVVPTDVERLASRCREEGVPDALGAGLEFRASSATSIP